MNLFFKLFQCGLFLIIPIVTFGFGIWLIQKHIKKNVEIAFAGLIGFIFFETSLVGMLIDPRLAIMQILDVLKVSVIVGIIAFLFVLIFLPIATAIYRIFK